MAILLAPKWSQLILVQKVWYVLLYYILCIAEKYINIQLYPSFWEGNSTSTFRSIDTLEDFAAIRSIFASQCVVILAAHYFLKFPIFSDFVDNFPDFSPKNYHIFWFNVNLTMWPLEITIFTWSVSAPVFYSSRVFHDYFLFILYRNIPNVYQNIK